MKRLAILMTILSLACCQKQENENNLPEENGPEPIGTYIYNSKEYPVFTAVGSADENTITVVISPLQPDEDISTYALIGINSTLEGQVIDVENAWNNDDYYFRYEDPVKYYSEYRKLQSGTIYIKRTGNSQEVYDIKADIKLPDGTDFKFEFNGKIASATL